MRKLQNDLEVKRAELFSQLSISCPAKATKDTEKVEQCLTGISPAQGSRKVIYTPGGTKRKGIVLFTLQICIFCDYRLVLINTSDFNVNVTYYQSVIIYVLYHNYSQTWSC